MSEEEINIKSHKDAVDGELDCAELRGAERLLYIDLFFVYRAYIDRTISLSDGSNLKKEALKTYRGIVKLKENTGKAERLRCGISKGIQNNENIKKVLCDAIKCIGCLCGDEAFVSTNLPGIEKWDIQ